MLKAVLSYSKKIPVPGQEFSSQSYHLSLEAELANSVAQNEIEIRKKLHEHFVLVKTCVEDELQNGKGETAGSVNGVGVHANGNNSGKKISNAQAKFALDLARKVGLSTQGLTQLVKKEFGVNGLYELNGGKGGQASLLIDMLKARAA